MSSTNMMTPGEMLDMTGRALFALGTMPLTMMAAMMRGAGGTCSCGGAGCGRCSTQKVSCSIPLPACPSLPVACCPPIPVVCPTGPGACEPTPCWEPVCLGRVTSVGCPGTVATLQFLICNEDVVKRTYKLTSDDPHLEFRPPAVHVGAKSKGCITALYTYPEDGSGCDHTVTLWLEGGFRRFYVRWRLAHGDGVCDCHVLDVDDRPDYFHHWYDHFYNCPPSNRTRTS